MIKALIVGLLTPIVLKRYGGIWGLKAKLMAQKKRSRLLMSIYSRYFFSRGGYVGLTAEFAGVPCMPHGPLGVFISDHAKIGKDVVIFQHVTIGNDQLADSPDKGSPVIGDHVYIGAGAKIIGNVKVGNHCRIGANAVVYKDMPDHSVAVCAATRILQKKNLDNRFIVQRDDGSMEVFENGRFRPYAPEAE